MPIKYYALLFLFLFLPRAHGFSLMLDPAGDAKNTGRIVNDNFERGITLQCAEQLKKTIETLMPSIRVILTRFPGESVEPLQNANFANRLNIDLYISINFYQETETKPHFYLYYVSYNDHFITRSYDLSFYPYDQAHRIHNKKTDRIAKTFSESLSEKKYTRLYDFKGSFGIPFKPLVGIISPAIAFEIGLKKSSDWQEYVQPIAQSIIKAIEEYAHE